MGYFPDLLAEYKDLLKQMRADGVTSGDLYREVQQAVRWMETTYDPAETRASTRVDAYTMDPYHMISFVSYLNSEDEELLPEFLQTVRKKVISDFFPYEWHNQEMSAETYVMRYFAHFREMAASASKNKDRINDALKGLTANEKAVFIAIKAEKMTYRRVAQMLGVEKRAVEVYLQRAIRKIERNKNGVQGDLFSEIA